MRQGLPGCAVDQRIEVGQPAQHLVGKRAGERLVGRAPDRLERGAFGLVERFAPPQHGIDQLKRGAARMNSGRLGHGKRPIRSCGPPPA